MSKEDSELAQRQTNSLSHGEMLVAQWDVVSYLAGELESKLQPQTWARIRESCSPHGLLLGFIHSVSAVKNVFALP